MNQPEYILAESEKMLHTEKQPDYIARDYLQVVADLEALFKELQLVSDLHASITRQVQALVVSLQEQE